MLPEKIVLISTPVLVWQQKNSNKNAIITAKVIVKFIRKGIYFQQTQRREQWGRF
jgi:hypothetical protein